MPQRILVLLLSSGLVGMLGLAPAACAEEKSAEPAKTGEAKTGEPKKEEPAEEIGVEKKLEAEKADEALKTISESFAKAPNLKARVHKVIKDDLLGDTEIGGTLSLRRPDKMQERMEGAPNAHQCRQLDGQIYREFNMATRRVMVKNFAKAPKKLALLRAAMTIDLAKLKEYFDFNVHRTYQGPEKMAEFRLVLTPRAGSKLDLPYEKIEAKLTEGAPFLNAISYQPKKGHGEPVTVKYSDFKVLEKLEDKDLEDDLVTRSPKEEEAVSDEAKK